MKRKLKLLLALTILSIVLILGYISCRKTDIPSATIPSIESKFFTSHRSADPVEKTIVDFLERENSKKYFVEKTVNQIGFPRWDKTVKRSNKATSVARPSIMSVGDNAPANTCDVYYIPFVRDSQNYVNASMVIKASPTDTSISYLCDWQYSQLQNNSNALDDQAENFAIFFMFLDNNVFGHTKFKITDKSIFRANNHDPRDITLNAYTNSNNRINTVNYVESCQDVTISWKDCPYAHCSGVDANGNSDGSCDGCPLCTNSITYTYCWWQWIDDGSNGGTSGGSGTGGTGNSGSTPPTPCNTSPPLVGQSVQNSVTTFSAADPCNSNPGWTPISGGPSSVSPDPCSTANNIAKQLDTLYANSNIDAKLSNIPNLATLAIENGFPIIQNFSINPYNSKDTTFTNSYCQGNIQTGTDSNINISYSVGYLNVLAATLHTHPSIGYAAQSAYDIYALIEISMQNSYYKGGFVAAANGSKYAVAITDKTLAAAFLNKKANNLNGTKWNENSAIGIAYNDAYKYYSEKVYNGNPNQINLAYEMAMATTLNNTGVTLFKQDTNGNFKPIVVNRTSTIKGSGIFKRTVATYTQTCN